MSEWADFVKGRARLIVDQIADLRTRLPNSSSDDPGLAALYHMLEELFEKDLRLAQLRDDSDLLLRAEGDAFEHDPKLQLVTTVFSNVTAQVTGLTRAILGVRLDGRFKPSSVDLGLSGIAKGSLYFGLKAQPPEATLPLLGQVDSLYDSTKRALQIIDDVAHTVEHDDEKISMEDVSEVVLDPRIRDAALVAVQRISPSGRQGIKTISVSGKLKVPAAELNANTRRAIRASLDKPVIRGDEIEFLGQVREIDLDARRFELRGIADEQVRGLRCAYRTLEGARPRELLGSTVRVRGLVERAADDVPRLMSVTSVQIVRPAPENLS